MKELPKLTSINVESILQSLLAESTKEIEEPYNNQYNKHRLAYLRQALKCVELFIEHERYNAIEARLDCLDGFISDIKQGMFSDDAAKWIRSKNGIQ
ncbi:hypothetical protein DSECCO2_408870 [anaerobic digester metagenome]